MAVVVMKFGGTSVANVERIRTSRATSSARSTPATRSPSSSRPWPARPTSSSPGSTRRPRCTTSANTTPSSPAASRSRPACTAIVLQSMGIKARSWPGWQIPIETSDAHGAARITDIPADKLQRLARGRRGRRHHRIPGHRAQRREPRLDAGARRLGHERGRRRGRAQGGRLRHLYRRRRRLHDRPAHRRQGPPPAEGLLRGNARNGVLGLEGAADALGRARHGAPRADARAVELRRAGGHGARARSTTWKLSAPSFATRTRSWNSRS